MTLLLLALLPFVPVTESATSGQVSAELTYQFDKASFAFKQLHFSIRRGGTLLVDEDLPAVWWPQSFGAQGASSVRVQDLDADGEPEVLLDLNSGGAHCCEVTTFYRFTGGAYVRRSHSWGNPGYRLQDLGNDGRPELITGDDRFNYAFSCFACSGVPVKIQRYGATGLVDVTRTFPGRIRADARRWWRLSMTAFRGRADPSGLLPAYLADEYLVGKSKTGWMRVRAAVARRDWPKLVAESGWKNRARYLAAVRRFLIKTGYA